MSQVIRTHYVSVLTEDGLVETITVKSSLNKLGKSIMETLSSLYQWDKTLPTVLKIQEPEMAFLNN